MKKKLKKFIEREYVDLFSGRATLRATLEDVQHSLSENTINSRKISESILTMERNVDGSYTVAFYIPRGEF